MKNRVKHYICNMIEIAKTHIDWVFGAAWGSVMWVKNSEQISENFLFETPKLLWQTILVTIVAFLAKKLIEGVYSYVVKKISGREIPKEKEEQND